MQSPLSFAGPVLVARDASGFAMGGASVAWRRLLLQADTVAPHMHVACIEGEHGSGKQTLARYLLSRSPLAGAEFQRYDAREWLLGEFDPASLAGFAYLDRADLLGPPGQALLLNVLKSLQNRPVSRSLIVVSSQQSLRHMAAQGLFLPDLAFRLTAVRFAIPPLRTRKEDIAPIVEIILEQLCNRYGHGPVQLGPGALARLLQHAWPGNVLELASVLESAFLETTAEVIRASDLAVPFAGEALQEQAVTTHPGNMTLQQMIRRHAQYVLDLNRGNKLQAARQLGISRSTLYRILGNEAIPTP